MSQSAAHDKNSVAIVGMSCIFPGAPSLESYWQNIVGGVDAVREPNDNEWNASFYQGKTKDTFGKIYCTRAGFITEYAKFDPLEFGIMPASLRGADPDQFLALRAAAEALQDAGYDHRTFDGERAEIVIGRTMAPGVGALNLIQHGQTVDQILNVVKALAPQLDGASLAAISEKLHQELNPCNADTIPAVMPNILAGRIANKLGFRGRNLVLDAACASSLVALEMTMQSLISGQADLAIAGGVHINSSPYFAQMFSELGALSTSGTIRPFDENADGTILGEGVGMVVIKRLADAQRDGNRIYAVVKGIGSSSDGRGTGSLAPNPEGEALAMKRAYDMSGVSPHTVQLLEAHGTGTRAGDRAEMKAIELVFGTSKAHSTGKPWCAIGSVKSMIGHTQAASGMAGIIKMALALHNKTLPPTLHFSVPSTQIDWNESPCYVITQAKPWAQAAPESAESSPRRAAVSAFGFGGINAHAILEEFADAENKPAMVTVAGGGNEKGAEKPKRAMVSLSLSYPEISGNTLAALNLQLGVQKAASVQFPAAASPSSQQARLQSQRSGRDARAPGGQSSVVDSAAAPSAAFAQQEQTSLTDQQAVLSAYIQALNVFQKNALSVHERVMMSYLQDDENS